MVDLLELSCPRCPARSLHAVFLDGRIASCIRAGDDQARALPELSRAWREADEEWEICTINRSSQAATWSRLGSEAHFRIGDGPVFSLEGRAQLVFRDAGGRFEGVLEVGGFGCAHYEDGLWHYEIQAADDTVGASAERLTIAPPSFFGPVSQMAAARTWAAPGPISRPSALAERSYAR